MRCPNGTRKNKQGDCIPKAQKTKRCPNGTRKNKQGDCIPKAPKTPQSPDLKPVISRIQRFMNRTKQKRREMYLKNICSEAGLCIAFGIESIKIKEFFRNFHFDLVDQVKRIGTPSSNGFVTELRYEKRGYNAYAVLKSNSSYDADNIMYEYRVGQFLNTMTLLFPCFLETYGLYKYKSEAHWKYMKSRQQITDNLFELLTPQPYDLSVGCEQSKYMAVLIQHIRGCKEVREILTPQSSYHILPILFQVYYPLFHMRKNFTHYDLHEQNVVLYQPVPGKYIQYHYHTEDGIISFKSPYVVKIIDYGRCYFKDSEDSKDIYDEVCQLPKCSPECGDNKGFHTFHLSNSRDFHHIISQQKNESHDLRFLDSVLKIAKTIALPPWLKVHIDKLNITYKHRYGTPEKFCKRKICSVTEAYRQLEKIIPLANVQLDLHHSHMDSFGDLNVYGDKPMEFRKI